MKAVSDLFNEIVDIDGNPTHVMRKGKGEPLLWLHGANGNHEWTPFLQALSENFDVIVPEHPGFGTSQRAPWINDMEDLVYHYRSLLDYFGMDKIHVVGQSFGGWLAAEFAASQTHRVKKLVLTASAGLWQEGLQRTDTFLLNQEQLIQRMFYRKDLAAKAAEKAKNPEEQEMFVRNRIALARYMFERMYNPKLKRLLKYVRVPTLIVWGEQDEIISPSYARLFAESIPNAKVRIIPDCGHVPYLEKTGEYLIILKEFLQD